MPIFNFSDADARTNGTRAAIAGMRAGEVWGINSDSSYALATDAFSNGVERIRNIKKQENFMTPILIGRPETLVGVVSKVTEEMQLLMDAFWPGPLSFIAKPNQTLAWSGSNDAITVRMPANEWTREVICALGPTVAVAATRSSSKAPTSAMQGAELWGSDVENWLDSGLADTDLLSTIIDFRGTKPNIVRLGALSASKLRQVVPAISMIAH
jgi:L-threonylcarbamoyladenylate synthase